MSARSLWLFALCMLMGVISRYAPPPIDVMAAAAFVITLVGFCGTMVRGGLRRPVV